jgi:hypothetical protein
MKNILLTAAVWLMVIQAGAMAQGSRLANAGKAGLYVRSLDEVLRLQDDEMDLGTAALIASEYWSDIVHGRRYLERLDAMALEVRNGSASNGSRPTIAPSLSSTTICSTNWASRRFPTPTIRTTCFCTRSWTGVRATA